MMTGWGAGGARVPAESRLRTLPEGKRRFLSGTSIALNKVMFRFKAFVPLVLICLAIPAAGFRGGISMGGGGVYFNLNSDYERFLGKLNPQDEESITRALDYYRRNFTPQASFETVNDRGYEDFKRFYDEVVGHITQRVQSNPAGEQNLIKKLDKFGLKAVQEGNALRVARIPGFLTIHFKGYLSPEMEAKMEAADR